jgi:hypothetical protein
MGRTAGRACTDFDKVPARTLYMLRSRISPHRTRAPIASISPDCGLHADGAIVPVLEVLWVLRAEPQRVAILGQGNPTTTGCEADEDGLCGIVATTSLGDV